MELIETQPSDAVPDAPFGEAAVTPSGYRRRVDRRDEHVAWLVGSIGFAGIAVMLAIDVLLFQIV